MTCYAKDLKPGYLICGHHNGWLVVRNVEIDKSLANQAAKNQFVKDVKITILCRFTGMTFTEEVNSYHVYKDVVEG